VLVRDWLGKQKPVDRDRALGEFARGYLTGHGPASDRDLARWAGIPLRDARAGLRAIAAELAEPDGGLVDLRVAVRRRRRTPAELPSPKLLGSFEPALLGWTSREDIVGKHKQLVTVGGMFHPFALADGRAVARWTMVNGKLELQPFGRLRRADRVALERDAEDVARFLAPPAGGGEPAARRGGLVQVR
jgi:hypothetical protein